MRTVPNPSPSHKTALPDVLGMSYRFNGEKGRMETRGFNVGGVRNNRNRGDLKWKHNEVITIHLDCDENTAMMKKTARFMARNWSSRKTRDETRGSIMGKVTLPKGKTWYPFVRCSSDESDVMFVLVEPKR